MFFTRRTALLRVTAMVGLAASAVLTADTLHPGRAFCPLEAACNAARESALGEIAGIPTSVIGILAFTGLFVLSMLPVSWGRKLLRPAGILAAVSGQGFILYQAFALGSFCPFCLVADGAALVAAMIILTWPPLPVYLSGKPLPPEPSRQRAMWALALMAALFVPFGWPRPQEPSWVEIAPVGDDLVEFAEADESAPPPVETVSPAPPPLPDEPPGMLFTSPSPGELPPPTATGLSIYPASTPIAVSVPHVATARTQPSLPPEPLAPEPKEAPKPEPVEVKAPPRPQVRIVEYLNAYCAHCRATHKRLDRVLHATDATVKRRRVYTWASNDWPMWARACAYAATVGLEDRMFEELMKSRGPAAREVYAAAQRAGLDLAGLKRALRETSPPARLVHDKKLQRAAGLRGLPTLDIGRRRLMGEQSEDELSAAVRAAIRVGPHS